MTIKTIINRALLITAVFLAASGCDRSRKGPRSEPSANITSISGSLAIMDKADFPYKDAYARIEDNNGNPITELKIGNIALDEDGKPVIPLESESSVGPLAIILILDRSGSMYGSPTTGLNDAAAAFVDKLSDRDFVEVIDFGTSVTVTQTFSNNKSTVKSKINSGDASMGLTALYDAVGKGIEDIQAIGGTRVIIAMTDGKDNSSNSYSLNSAISAANKIHQEINTIGYGGVYNPTNLQQLASSTGGEYAATSSGTDLYEAYQEMVPDPVVDHVKIRFRSLNEKADVLTMYVAYGPYTCHFSREYTKEDE